MSLGRVERLWETFVRRPDELQEGVEIPMMIRDLTPGPRKYGVRHVVAQISRSPGALSDSEPLWVRSTVGVRLDQPWAIKVLRELPLELPGEPYRDFYEALRRAGEAARREGWKGSR